MNELLSSNLLASFYRQGGLLQVAPNQFILLIGAKTSISELSQSANVLYSPDFWDFLGQKNPFYCYEKLISVTRAQLEEMLAKYNQNSLLPIDLVNDHIVEFKEQFAWSKEQFKLGHLQKTVPITKFHFKSRQAFSFLRSLSYALGLQKSGFLYGEWTTNEQNHTKGYLGLTPEILATWDGQSMHTMALAGTWTSLQNYKSVSEVDRKTLSEHAFVVEDIKNRLADLMIEPTQILDLVKLSHLQTKMSKPCISKQQFMNDLQKLHPTAALGIYPRVESNQQEFAKMPLQRIRNQFGAPFGLITDVGATVVVGIRNIAWNNRDNSLDIFVGCGVTADSDEQKEWQELQNKKSAVMQMFGLE